MTVDFEQYADEETATEDQLTRLGALVERQVDLEQQIADTKTELKELETQLHEIAWRAIPDLLDETGLSEVKLADGTKVQVKDVMRVSTTGQYREPINRWLTEHGYQDMIKDEVVAQFPAGEGERAAAAVRWLTGQGVSTDRKEYVNASSFKAFLKELMDAGEVVPLEELGAHVQRMATLVRPK